MNMNCKKAEEYLVDYLYQELPAKKTLEIEKHLQECSNCSATLESWRAIHRAYQRSTEEPLVAPYTKQKILAIAEQELLRPRPWSEKFLWALKLATVPLAIFILVLFLNSKKDPSDMALHEPQMEAPAPVVQSSERAAATPKRQLQNKGEREQTPAAPETKLRTEEQSVYTDDLRARLNEEARSDKDAAGLKKKDESMYATGNELDALSSSAPEPPPPAAAAPLESAAEMEQQYAPQQAGRSATKVSAISKDAEEPFQEAQKQLQIKNVKEGQKLLDRAVALDDSKALASQLHQEGNSYQSRGEYVNAIMQFEKVQANYRDYARIDEVLIRLGDSYAEVGQYDKAAQAYSQVRSQKNVARERIQRLQKKQEANEQLKALGYVSEPKKQ